MDTLSSNHKNSNDEKIINQIESSSSQSDSSNINEILDNNNILNDSLNVKSKYHNKAKWTKEEVNKCLRIKSYV